jgi:hypothetical protein
MPFGLEWSEPMRLVAFVVVLALPFEAMAAETCTSYLTAQREKMIEAALACEGTASQKQSVRSQAEAARNGEKLMTFDDCSRPLAMRRSADLFDACVRTHLCAAQTYACAIARTNAQSSIKECGAATSACKITDPIPQ